MTSADPSTTPPPPNSSDRALGSRSNDGPARWALDLVAGATLSLIAGGTAGAGAGFLWGGIGGRVAMRVLFLTSNATVRGVQSDDGFEIGRISTDSIFLIIAMTFVGAVLGAGYGLLRMAVRGPLWLVATGVAVALGIGAGGGMIVSAGGVDFTLLGPLWLAVGLFVFLPAAWGVTVVVATERLLHYRSVISRAAPAIDARPLGAVGDVIGWGTIAAITLAGALDLLQDLERLT